MSELCKDSGRWKHLHTGLHRETLLEAEEQLRLLVSLLPGITIPHSLALMQVQLHFGFQNASEW